MKIENGVLSKVDNIDIKNGFFIVPDGVEVVGKYAFDNCKNLKTVIIPEGVTEIADSAFCYCEQLVAIKIPATVIKIDKFAFYHCSNLLSVSFAENSQLNSIGARAFADCEKLADINIPYQVKFIGDGAFNNCINLIPNPIIVSTSTKVEKHRDWNTPRIKRRSKPQPTLAEKIASAEERVKEDNPKKVVAEKTR